MAHEDIAGWVAFAWWIEHCWVWDGLLEVKVLHEISAQTLAVHDFIDGNAVLGNGNISDEVAAFVTEEVGLQFTTDMRAN